MKPKPRNPQTPEQWQEAVDLAEFMLHLDAARKYGLLTGGPEINVDRCQEMLALGKRQGYTPSDGCVQRLAREAMEFQG